MEWEVEQSSSGYKTLLWELDKKGPAVRTSFTLVLNFEDFLKQGSLLVPANFDPVIPNYNQHVCRLQWYKLIMFFSAKTLDTTTAYVTLFGIPSVQKKCKYVVQTHVEKMVF